MDPSNYLASTTTTSTATAATTTTTYYYYLLHVCYKTERHLQLGVLFVLSNCDFTLLGFHFNRNHLSSWHKQSNVGVETSSQV